jgi:hypothetical protein
MSLSAGHDAWIVGNQRYVMTDFTGVAEYAQPAKK